MVFNNFNNSAVLKALTLPPSLRDDNFHFSEVNLKVNLVESFAFHYQQAASRLEEFFFSIYMLVL